MLLKLSYTAATVGWLLTRLQAEAFAVVGIQKLSKTSFADASHGRSLSTAASTPRTIEACPRPPHSFTPLCMSTGGNAVESTAGTKSEERSVLDALIDQFTSPKSGNVTATVEEYLDLCDHAFLTHLRRRIEAEEAESPKVRRIDQPARAVRIRCFMLSASVYSKLNLLLSCIKTIMILFFETYM